MSKSNATRPLRATLELQLATAIAERDEARRALAEMWSVAWLLMWRAIGDSISADDWCNEWARSPSPEAFAEVTRERDALKAGRWAGAWDGSERRTVAGGKAASLYAVDGWSGPIRWHWQANQCEASGTVDARDAAKAAADAHLIAAGWFLAGGPHGAGEAK